MSKAEKDAIASLSDFAELLRLKIVQPKYYRKIFIQNGRGSENARIIARFRGWEKVPSIFGNI